MNGATGEKAARRPRGMGRIFQRPGSACWWIAYYHRGKEIRESSETTDERQAEKLLKQRIREIHAHQLGARRFVGPAQERVTVGERLDALEADYKLQGTLTPQVRSHLKPLRAAFGDRRAVDVTAEMVDRYIQDRLTPQHVGDNVIPGKAPATVNRETQLLGQAFRLSIQRGHLNTAPIVRHLDETGNVRQGFFEREDFEAVVKNLPEYLQDFARFAYFTGWRKGEIAALTWGDVDGRLIRLPGKASKNRRGKPVPLEGPLKAIIERRWKARQYSAPDGTATLSPYVFHQKGQPVGDFRKAWATACKAAGCPGRHFHDFCRTAIRNLVRAGVPETVAMAITGRRTRAIFDRYNITSERDLQDAMRRLEAHVNAMPAGQTVRALPVANEAAGQ